MFTYPAACNRLVELFSLLALVETDEGVRNRAVGAVTTLAQSHPGTVRPPSDQFAASLLPTVVVLLGTDPIHAREYVRRVAQWVLDRHDEASDGLGLGGIDEDERTQFERLAAGATTLTTLQLRRSSYMAGALLDAVCLTGAAELYDAVRNNLNALRVVSSGTRALESDARWRRGGPDVYPQPRIDYPEWKNRTASEPQTDAAAIDAVLLASVARTRHYLSAYEALLANLPTATN